MELLTSPKSEYLLQAGIPVLHSESQEWLEEIAFMDDEVRFFLKLLSQVSEKKANIQDPGKFERLEKDCLQFRDKLFRELETGIKSHEEYLAGLMRDGNTEDQADYRWKHARLKNGFENVKAEFRNLKKTLFEWVANQKQE